MELNDSLQSKRSTARKAPPRLTPNHDLTVARINRGWMPNDLARIAGVHGNTVRDAEKGFYVDARTQASLARALGFGVVTDLFPLERQREFQPRRKGRR